MNARAAARGRARNPTRTGLVLGMFLAPSALGMSAAPVALPALATDLHLGTGATAWVLAGYTLTLSVSTALCGRLADLRGPRGSLAAGMALLVAGTALIGLAPSYPLVVLGRLVQGAGAGTAAVLAFAIAGAIYPNPTDRGRALGTMGALVGIVSGAGALAGGSLTDLLGWRAALALPVLSALAAVFVAHLLPGGSGQPGARLDGRGALLCLALVAAIAIPLQAPATGLPGWLTALAGALAVVLAAALAAHTAHRPDGFLPRSLVGNRPFTLSAFAGFTLFAGYLIIQFAAPPLLLARHHLTATQIGLIFLPTGLASAALSNYGGRLAARVPPLRIITVLAAASTAALLLAAAAGLSPVPLVLAVALAVSAFSTGQTVLMGAVPLLVDPNDRGIATGVFQLVFLTGGSLGSAAVGGLSGALPLRASIALLAPLPLAGLAAALLAQRSPPTTTS